MNASSDTRPDCRSQARPRPAGTRRGDGFTIIELMVTIAILAVLMIIGIPAFRDAALSSRLTSIANELVGSVQMARSEAIKRNDVVQLCVSTNGTGCTAGEWHQGWIILVGADPTPANPVVVQRHEALPAGYRAEEEVGGAIVLTFRPTGFGGTQAEWKVCRAAPLGSQERRVRVGPTGGTDVSRGPTAACP